MFSSSSCLATGCSRSVIYKIETGQHTPALMWGSTGSAAQECGSGRCPVIYFITRRRPGNNRSPYGEFDPPVEVQRNRDNRGRRTTTREEQSPPHKEPDTAGGDEFMDEQRRPGGRGAEY